MWLQLLVYASLLFFVFAFIVKALKYARMPIHLRWELYPVAHEAGHKSGGSYLEELDWQSKPRRKNILGELRYMAREGLLFEKCYHNNRGLWWFTYPFHLGLFLLIGWLILLCIDVLVMPSRALITESANTWAMVIDYLILGVGVAGFVLSIFGCVGLLIKRSADENLRLYTSPADYFNLSFVLAVLLSGLSAWCFFTPVFTEFIRSLITFRPIDNLNLAMATSLALFSLFLIYIPFTHMMHGLAKYFTYHRTLWDDEPNICGSDIEKAVGQLLDQRITWSAPHIGSGKTWNEVVSRKE